MMNVAQKIIAESQPELVSDYSPRERDLVLQFARKSQTGLMYVGLAADRADLIRLAASNAGLPDYQEDVFFNEADALADKYWRD